MRRALMAARTVRSHKCREGLRVLPGRSRRPNSSAITRDRHHRLNRCGFGAEIWFHDVFLYLVTRLTPGRVN
jgi:hypothetical protein